jgi:hypothetical protein
MLGYFVAPKRVLFALVLCLSVLLRPDADASNVQFVGAGGYTISGSTVVLTANEIANFDAFGYSGTLRLELWALPTPYAGGVLPGYKLAQYTLGQLTAGYHFSNVNSGPMNLVPPPNGTWALAMVLTEYFGGPVDDGYSVDDYVNFPNPLVIGPPSPPPPALVPQVGLWWNPNESGTGYALDYKHGVLVVTIYSFSVNGAPQWYLAAGPLEGYTFTATLDKYVGGQCIACTYSGSPSSVGNDGAITITFSSPTQATLYLPNNRITRIQPQAF